MPVSEQVQPQLQTPEPVPLERYARTNKISWSRISEADRKIVWHFMSANDPNFAPTMRGLAEMFDAQPIGFEVHPMFWRWLEQIRAWQRERARGGDLPRPEVPRIAA